MENEELLQKLEELMHKDTADFTEDEVKTIKKMVRVYSAFEVLGSIGQVIKTTLLWFAAIIGTWLSLKSGLISWIGTLK
jgi:hypothetical protein